MVLSSSINNISHQFYVGKMNLNLIDNPLHYFDLFYLLVHWLC